MAERIDEMRLREVIGILEKFKALEYARDRARQYAEQAQQDLNIFKQSLAKESLLALADYFVYRQM